MTTLRSLLRQRTPALAKRWLEATLSSYPKDSSSFLRREGDPFANPVGRALREGTRGILDSLLGGMDAEDVCRHLEEIIKIRAIQDLTPSRAVSFVFLLKEAIRDELGGEASNPQRADELAKLDAEVDQIALFAFDIFTRCREQVYELRVNEVKRNVAAVMKRFTEGDDDPEPRTPRCAGTREGGSQ